MLFLFLHCDAQTLTMPYIMTFVHTCAHVRVQRYKKKTRKTPILSNNALCITVLSYF